MTIYDVIGANYAQVRRADPRLTAALVQQLALPAAARVLDVGAGTGKYACALADRGLHVLAVEPSQVMLAQARPHAGVRYLRGVAEQLPLAAGAVDGVVSVIALHHFRRPEQALAELDRVSARGRMVIVTGDVRLGEPYWFHDYFGAALAANLERFEPLGELVAQLERWLERPVAVAPLLIPRDFSDLFCGAAWSRPELYLRPEYHASTSSLAQVAPAVVEAGMRRLATDLRSGAFRERHAALDEREALDLGVRVLTVAAAPARADRRRV